MVIIIGGGIAGLTCAKYLKDREELFPALHLLLLLLKKNHLALNNTL